MAVKFRVLDGFGKLLFQTGNIPVPKNFFNTAHKANTETYERHGSAKTGYFSMNTCKDKCSTLLSGSKCEKKVCRVLLVYGRDLRLKRSQKHLVYVMYCMYVCMYVTFGVFDVCSKRAASSDRLCVLVMASPNIRPYLAASTAMLTGTNTGLACATVTPCVASASRKILLRYTPFANRTRQQN